MNVKMPIIVDTLTYMNLINDMLISVKHEESFITLEPHLCIGGILP